MKNSHILFFIIAFCPLLSFGTHQGKTTHVQAPAADPIVFCRQGVRLSELRNAGSMVVTAKAGRKQAMISAIRDLGLRITLNSVESDFVLVEVTQNTSAETISRLGSNSAVRDIEPDAATARPTSKN